MKALFLLLTAINIAILLWEYKKGAFSKPEPTTEENIIVSQEPIILLHELPKNPETSKQTPPENPLAITTTAKPGSSTKNLSISCLLAGPFSNQTAYNIWQEKLATAAKNITAVKKTEQIIVSYVVFYPTVEPPGKAQDKKNIGITDVWLFNKDKPAAEISLGTFNKEEQALELQQNLQNKGLFTKIKPKLKDKVQLYAVIQGNEAAIFDISSSFQPPIDIKASNECKTP